MPNIQFGFIMPADRRHYSSQATFVADLNRALDLVTSHFDSAWMVDHLQFGDAFLLEGFTALTYMAALHPRLKFGHTVLSQSFRNPALLAKMAATLQFLSGGRFILGLGAGGHAEDYQAYGYDFPPAAVRVAQLEEAIQIIQALWTDSPATFAGQHYRIHQAYCEPRPNPPPSLMVGAFKPKMLRLTACYADGWNVSSTGLPQYRRLAADFDRACADVSRDPSRVQRSWGGGCICAPTQAEAERLASDLWGITDPEDNFDFVGTPRRIIEQMRPFIDLGINYFMLDCSPFPDLTTLELLAGEVLPALNQSH